MNQKCISLTAVLFSFCSLAWAQPFAPASYALNFNGTNNFVQIPLNSPPSSAYTISAWIYLRSGGNYAGTRMAVLTGPTCDSSIELLVHSQTTNYNDPQYLELGRCGDFNGFLSTSTVPLNTWTYVAATFDSGAVCYYINGNPAGTFTEHNPSNNYALGSSIILGGGNNPRAFNGFVDEVQIWSQALSASEIATYWNQQRTGNESGLYAYYQFNEGTGSTTADNAVAAGGGAGQFVNSPGWQLSGAGLVSLGASILAEGAAAGSDGVVLSIPYYSASWTAVANDSWLHVNSSSQSGTTSSNVIFSFDANPGVGRIGTLTIDNQTLTVVQGGGNCAPVPISTLVSSGLSSPHGLAVDNAGNLDFVDSGHNSLKQFNPATGQTTTLASSNLNNPTGVAVDGAGLVYIADLGDDAIKTWTPAGGVYNYYLTGLNNPRQVAVDGAGNVYIATGTGLTNLNAAIDIWNPTSRVLSTSFQPDWGFFSFGLIYGLAVDAAADIYLMGAAEIPNYGITSANGQEWGPNQVFIKGPFANGTLNPSGVAVDGSGDFYYADGGSNIVLKWSSGSSAVTTVTTDLRAPAALAADATGDLFIADTGNNAIRELPHVFVDATPILASSGSGNYNISVAIPNAANIPLKMAPTTDQPWLYIIGVTQTNLYFNCGTNLGSFRSGHITIYGQVVTIYQEAAPGLFFGATNLAEGPNAGTDSVAVAMPPISWTATPNAPWLHAASASQFGATNLIFSFDTNPGPTRVGAISVADQMFTVTQGGSTYVAANPTVTLAPYLSNPWGITLDSSGDVYIADGASAEITEWVASSDSLVTVIDSGLQVPTGVALDSLGDLFIDDPNQGAILELPANSSTLSTVVGGFDFAIDVAIDGSGNLYIADDSVEAVFEWLPSTQTLNTLFSGLDGVYSLALDVGNNVYVANLTGKSIIEWSSAHQSASTLFSGLGGNVYSVGVDGLGNVYAGTSSGISKWSAASQTVNGVLSGVAGGLAGDAAGNLYAATGSGLVEKVRAFVDTSAKVEPASAGTDSLSPVLPVTENLLAPFAPNSDQSWLTITGVTNDVVSFAFTGNISTSSRTAHISLLGQTITVTQNPLVLADATMQIVPNGAQATVSWNPPTPGLYLQETLSLSPPNWSNSPSGTNNPASVSVNVPAKFFRLVGP